MEKVYKTSYAEKFTSISLKPIIKRFNLELQDLLKEIKEKRTLNQISISEVPFIQINSKYFLSYSFDNFPV